MIEFNVQTSGLDKGLQRLARLSGNLDAITSHAINSALKGTHDELRSSLSAYIDRPSPWTTRGLLRRSSTPTNLTAAVGFNYGDGEFTATFVGKGIGTPAGRYMDIQARGGNRVAKSTERKLRNTGILDPGQFITPTGNSPGRLDSYGNVRPGVYNQALAGLRAGSGSGYDANTPAGRTTAGRYWVPFARGQQGATFPNFTAIAVRSGRRPAGRTGLGSGNPGRPATSRLPRELSYVFNITRQPRYSVRYPFKKLATTAFASRYSESFRRAVLAAIDRP